MNSPIQKLSKTIVRTLTLRGETISTAESITGGLIGGAITGVPGSSEVFLGGVISYSNQMKKDELGITAADIKKVGVVSEAIAVAMALAIQKRTKSTWAISSTGVAGPGPVDGIPAGTVWIAIAGPKIAQGIELSIAGKREIVRLGAVESALGAFERILSATKLAKRK
ncbi:MAG: CinA family protein [Actinobacteria bacterium]|nr:CinA family protein [Actinomycetota bacterium]